MNLRSALRATVLSASVFAIAGCAGNPLVGTWVTPFANGGLGGTGTMTLSGDGTASFKINITGGNVMGVQISCTGEGLTYSGVRWTSTATEIAFTGSSTCAGMITCSAAGMQNVIDCNAAMMGGMNNLGGSNNYTLSSNNNTLTFTSGNLNNNTFTRMN